MENKSLTGTQTEHNLISAFTAEATSTIKYRLFADESDYQEIEDMFLRVADDEEEHAEVFLELLNAIGDDADNLKHSIALEGFASKIDYPESARIAREEGFDHIADTFDKIAAIELRHKALFASFLDKIEKNTMLKSNSKSKWICLKCGHIHEGTEPPKECPVCSHSSKHFKIM